MQENPSSNSFTEKGGDMPSIEETGERLTPREIIEHYIALLTSDSVDIVPKIFAGNAVVTSSTTSLHHSGRAEIAQYFNAEREGRRDCTTTTHFCIIEGDTAALLILLDYFEERCT
jgi:hypothetical protein